MTLTLFWEALRSPSGDFTVFVHLVAPDGQVVAQRDSQPVRGNYRTSEWQAGELVLDKYVILIPADATPGEYTLIVGLYHAGPADRLPVSLDGNESSDEWYALPDALTVG